MKSESKVINQGGFGCIFYPSLPCKKEQSHSEKAKEYVSKLVERNFSSKNEIEVGEIVKKNSILLFILCSDFRKLSRKFVKSR